MNEDRIPLAEARRRHSPKAPNPDYIAPKLHGVVDPITLADKPVPGRRWLVEGWIPHSAVTMLGGDGGVGKSLIAQQLITCAATGKDWLGQITMPCKAIAIFCEDDADELHRRQEAINRYYDVEFGDLENAQWVSRVGDENTLMRWEQYEAAGFPTEFYQQVHDLTQDTGAQLLVLDALHDLFPGNENSRPQARQFIQLLHSLARDMDGTVVLTAHPSLSGRNSGTGESGSTAWNNAVRSRMYLTKPRDDQGGEDDGDLRVLQRRKANYANTGDEIRLTWRDGVFATLSTNGGIIGAIEGNIAERVFLDLLGKREAEGRPVSHKSRAGSYAPKEFAKRPDRQGIDKRAFGRAMEGLFSSGSIKVVRYGKSSDSTEKIIPTSERMK